MCRGSREGQTKRAGEDADLIRVTQLLGNQQVTIKGFQLRICPRKSCACPRICSDNAMVKRSLEAKTEKHREVEVV